MAKVSDISLDTSSTWPLLSSKGDDGQRESTNKCSRRSLQGRKSYAVREQSQHAVYSLSSANVMCLKCSALEFEGKAAAHRTSAVDARYRMRQKLARSLSCVNMHRAVF